MIPSMCCAACKTDEGTCCTCLDEIPVGEQELVSNPYQDAVWDDQTLHLECKKCREISTDDI